MRDLESCVNKKELGWVLEKLHFHNSARGKVEMLKHLQDNPEYKCYFCNGLNKDCEEYLCYVNRFVKAII